MSNLHQTTYYEVLGVAHNAKMGEIKQRYRELCLKFHPDREGSAVATSAMALINESYEWLSDPIKRAAYDIMLQEGPAEPCQNASPQVRREENELFGIETRWEIRAAFVLAVSISCVIGYLAVPALGSAKSISSMFMDANREFLMATIHEAVASLPLFIPVFGMAWGVLAAFVNGAEDKAVIISAYSLSAKASATVLAYTLIAMTIKAVAYYIGICRSYNLARLIRRRKFTEWDKFYSKGDFLIAVLLSLTAGWVEFAITNVH